MIVQLLIILNFCMLNEKMLLFSYNIEYLILIFGVYNLVQMFNIL